MLGPPLKMLAWARKCSTCGFGFGDLLLELVDLRLQRLLRVVGLGERACRQHRAVGLGDAVGNVGGELGVIGGEADADDAAFLRRIDLEALEERLEDAILLALLVAVADVERLEEAVELAWRLQRGVELRIGGELLLGDDL